MKKNPAKLFWRPLCLLAAFVLWTFAVSFIDVQAIGPRGSCVGFATINQYFHELTGVHLTLYVITDWLGLVPFAICVGFATLGLVQWITRKSLFKVDYSLFVLGGFYLVVIAVYLLFESVVVNYRPVLLNDFLEASFPSSTTLLVLCVMPTTMLQLQTRIKNPKLRNGIIHLLILFTLFMIIGRLVSGVHWITDIVGSLLLCAGLVTLYKAVVLSIYR